MINIIDENLIRIITNPGRTFTGKILLGANTYSSIMNIKYKAPFSASGALSIGETPSAMIDVEMTDISPNLRGMELEAVISIEGQDFSQGLFTVDEPTEKDGVVKFTAYDRMNGANGETYVSELTYPTTVQAVFDEVCAQLGYTAEAVAEGDNIEVTSDVLSGYDCRTALGYLAAYIGKNCVCGIDGIFRMKGFAVQNVTVDEDTVSEAEIGKQESVPRYLSCTVAQDTVHTSGEGTQGISFVCPLMTQERLDAIFSDLIGTEETPGVLRSYYSADVTQLCGDPRLETGDVITLECYGNTYTVPIMNVEREFDGGLSCKFNSYEPVKEINLTLAQKVELLTQETKKQKQHFAEAQTTLTENMMNALGLFTTTEQMSDGSVKYYFHNKTDIEESTYIITFNSNGFAYTKGSGCWNGGNPTWQYGIDSSGNAVLNTLALHGLTADWIKAGMLQSLDGTLSFDIGNSVLSTRGTLNGVLTETVIKQGEIATSYERDNVKFFSILGLSGLSFVKNYNSGNERQGRLQYDDRGISYEEVSNSYNFGARLLALGTTIIDGSHVDAVFLGCADDVYPNVTPLPVVLKNSITADSFRYTSGATALPVFSVPVSRGGQLDLSDYLTADNKSRVFWLRVTLLHYRGNSEYLIFFNGAEVNAKGLWVDCVHVSSRCVGGATAAGVGMVPVLEGILPNGGALALTEPHTTAFFPNATTLTVTTANPAVGFDSYITAIVEPLGVGR